MHRILGFIVLAVFFVLGFWWAQKFLSQVTPSVITNNIIQKVVCDAGCRKEIKDEVLMAIGTPTPAPKVQTSVPTQTTKQTQFISLDGSYSTTSTDWVDIPGTDVTFDLEKGYSKNARVDWQATLKVADANGQAFARLFDTTHGIAVSNSEISTINNSDYKTAYSGPLNLWSGSINYRVQIRSLNTFNVSYIGGKIRIEY